jgi:hypothetical protein
MNHAACSGALDVAVFVREMMEMHPSMHQSLLQQLRVAFPQLQSARVYTTVLWMLAEYSSTTEDLEGALETILQALGPAPLTKANGSVHPSQHTVCAALMCSYRLMCNTAYVAA